MAEDRIVSLFTEGRGILVVSDEGAFHAEERLAQIEGRLPGWFVRTHRTCIANAHRVSGIARFSLAMDDGSECPISQHRYLDIADKVKAAAEKKLTRE